MENLKIYNQLKEVPEIAKKKISGGRLNGMTDISPMWRIKKMTEVFGICGFGWKYEITKMWTEKADTQAVSCFVNILLYVKQNDVWSDPIPANGGSSFVAVESKGAYQSDECYKMATTDALGTAMKMLGLGADVYFEKDRTKYSQPEEEKKPSKEESDRAFKYNALINYAKNITDGTPEKIKEFIKAEYKVDSLGKLDAQMIGTLYDKYIKG